MTGNRNVPLLLLLCIAAPLAHAETTTPEPAEPRLPVIQNLTESLDFLNAIKEKKLPVEAVALQTALNRILDLWNAQNEDMVNDLRNNINIIPKPFIERAHDYLERLRNINLKNEETRAAINQNLPVHKIIARGEKLQTERQALEPVLNDIIDFTSIFTNHHAITKATNRLSSIIKEEKKIRIMLSQGKWLSFVGLIQQTNLLIKNAAKLNKGAIELLAEPDETEGGVTIESLIIQSENNIKAAYTNFLTMSKLINIKK